MQADVIENMESRPNRARRGTALYLHLPFCRVKCTYCAFAISTDQRLEDRYVAALREEIRNRVPQEILESIYLGGGTPSRLSPESVEGLGAELSRFSRETGAEVTIEVNPEDVSRDALGRWVDHLGVNRVSVGVQSFHDAELEPLGRQHGAAVAIEAVELAASVVPRVSLDLILGLPRQSVESVRSSTETAMALPVGHLSLYLLDLEPGSALEGRVRSGLASLPADEQTAEMYREVVRLATRAGLEQYEVSNFARSGEEAVHNRRYWMREPYVGVGIGAHSFDGTVREGNVRSLADYVSAIESGESAVSFREELTPEEVRHERLFLGMRQNRGLPLDELIELGGEHAREWLDESRDRGWVEVGDDAVRFTVEGLLLSDELLARLF